MSIALGELPERCYMMWGLQGLPKSLINDNLFASCIIELPRVMRDDL